MKKLCLVLVFCFLAGGMIYGEPYLVARVKNLSNRKYFENTLNAINNAKKNIYVVMYSVNYFPKDVESPSVQLINGLADARKRGVKVRVIFDSRKKTQGQEASYSAYDFLKNAGVDVDFDSLSVTTHSKVIVVDGRIVILGSANWSDAAINENNEANVLIYSPALAVSLAEDIDDIRLSENPKKQFITEAVSIPYNFILNKDAFRRMARDEDTRSLDVYLILLAENSGGFGEIVPIGYEEVAQRLGLAGKMDENSRRRQINKTLKKLAYKYKIIDLETEFNKPFSVKLKDQGGEFFLLTKDYWDWGWDRILAMREKVCLLINLAEIGKKKYLSEWSMSGEGVSKRYGVSPGTFQQGMIGLKRYNIVDVEYVPVKDKKFEFRDPNIYRYKGLYDVNKFNSDLVSLEKTYGAEKVSLARGYADIVWKAYDPDVIKDIMHLMDIYGEDIVNKGFKIIANKRTDNPQRNIHYAAGVIKRLGEKEKKV